MQSGQIHSFSLPKGKGNHFLIYFCSFSAPFSSTLRALSARGLGRGGRRVEGPPDPGRTPFRDHQPQQGTQGLDPPEELGHREPEDVTDDEAEGPQEEGGAAHLPDGPQQRAPLSPLLLQEGLRLWGFLVTASFPFKCSCLGVP